MDNLTGKVRVDPFQNNVTLKDDVIRDHLINAVHSTPGFMYLKDDHFKYLMCNENFAKAAGLNSPEDVIGKTDYDLVWGKTEADLFRKGDIEALSGIKKINFEEPQLQADGITKIVLANKVPLYDTEHKIIGVLGNYIDITERKKTEEEMRKIVMVLVGDIVHDLRTPIATIRTIAQLLSTIFPNLVQILEDAKQLGSDKIDLLSKKELNSLYNGTFVNALENSVSMMNDFINSTLKELTNAQKAQSELTSIDLTRCSSRRILENTLDAYPFEPGVKVYQNTSYDFELMGNSILIMKILFNLLRNAEEQILYQGKGEITISTRSVEGKNLISVKDTAGGVAPELIDNIFTGYFTTKKQGTGIGLTFCRETMKSFGGELTCNNVYGESVEFILEFPPVDE
jgi:PAS domain S-box-containing protein